MKQLLCSPTFQLPAIMLEPKGHITQPPVLIVEIFSKSTQLKDRNTKFNMYGFCGVKYYLMADPDTKSVEVYELIDNKYKQMFAPLNFVLAENCVIELDWKAAIES